MDPLKNPYAPGAGSTPPLLAGRDALIQRAAFAIDRIRGGYRARGFIFYGLRGVGKTVLLHRIRLDAEARNVTTVKMEACSGRSLPALLIPSLRAALLRMLRDEEVESGSLQAMRALASFTRTCKLTFSDIEAGVEAEPQAGLADSGDFAADLSDLMMAVGAATYLNLSALALFIDELQYVPEKQFAALVAALDNVVQLNFSITLFAAGLPQVLGQSGRAHPYVERLFEFVLLDRLDETAACDALVEPASRQGVVFTNYAVNEVLRHAKGYPYFLQEWGWHCWNVAKGRIDYEEAERASVAALAELDASFFRLRFDGLTPNEKRYLRAMAQLGPGPHRSGDIAKLLGQKVTAVAPLRNTLIAKGMLFSPAHGVTSFTAPMFDDFLKRIMPKIRR